MVAGPRSAACVLAIASAGLAGCGGDGGTATVATGTGTTSAGAVVDGIHVLAVVDVHETEFRLEPRAIRFERFGYYGLRAINDGTVPHALAIEGHGLEKRTKAVEPGESETMVVLFQKAGRYELYCPVDGHAQQGMKGTVRVH